MQNSNDKVNRIQVAEPHTYSKAQEILKKSLINSSNFKKKNQVSNVSLSLSSTNTKFKILKRISRQHLKNSFVDLLQKQPSKELYIKAIKSFYKAYKLSIYNLLMFIQLKLLKNLNIFKKSYRNHKAISKYYFALLASLIQKLKYYKMLGLKTFREFNRPILKELILLKTRLILSYKKNLQLYSAAPFVLKLAYKLDNTLVAFFHRLTKRLSILGNWNFFLVFGKNVEPVRFKLKQFLLILKDCLLQFLSFDKKQLISFYERTVLVFGIYFLPFIFLATQALVPLIDEYEYLIINPVTSSIFSKVPFLIDSIKLVRPFITNPMLLFWVPLGYYLTFTSAYRALKISYKVAFNGTIASIFLIINYSCVLMQFMMKLAFDSIKIIKDIFFTSYLIKHLGKNKNKERDEAMKIFANLVNRYDTDIRKNYYEFLLLINHRVFSHLALISLAALVYNCIYYIIHNKNPEIILVTKTALATIKNPQEEE
uniref:hypothetical protein Ycf60 n=1 Tax=Lietzensia polymorpha TaxID=2962110 RepID=UPI00218223F9|nr:hypothetical protein Ycf60 [Lietzensia polymorpha]UVI61258.1 hypothetical protein Ycf60 [Lietzensia polymorpha]